MLKELGEVLWIQTCPIVLILILMEHAQRVHPSLKNMCATWVLILILMEHAQRVCSTHVYSLLNYSLNPYFNGTCSKSYIHPCNRKAAEFRLNPYFNGTCSKRKQVSTMNVVNGLNPYFNGTCSKRLIGLDFACMDEYKS